jgi:hypothetical protein
MGLGAFGGGSQRLVGGDSLTAWPILRGMAKRSSHYKSAPPLLLFSAEQTKS